MSEKPCGAYFYAFFENFFVPILTSGGLAAVSSSFFAALCSAFGLYKNANCIFTNTYHGMLFCIIFKKQFLFFVQKGSGAAENDRFYSLMSMLHLEDRMVTSGDTACISEKMKRPIQKIIDYEKVYCKLAKLKQKTDVLTGFRDIDDLVPNAVESEPVAKSFVKCHGWLGHLGDRERRAETYN